MILSAAAVLSRHRRGWKIFCNDFCAQDFLNTEVSQYNLVYSTYIIATNGRQHTGSGNVPVTIH